MFNDVYSNGCFLHTFYFETPPSRFSPSRALREPKTTQSNVSSQGNKLKTRSSWLNCALRDDEAVYWVSIGHYEAVAVGN